MAILASSRNAAISSITALALLFSSCTTTLTGEKAFHSFGECMAANAGGIGIGTLIRDRLSMTDSKQGRPLLVGAALVALAVAWQRCGATYQTVSNTEVKTRDEVVQQSRHAARKGKTLEIDALKLQVGAPGQDMNSAIRYTVLSDDPDRKDISVKETRIIQIPKQVERQGTIYFADDNEQPLKGADGRPIPVKGNVPYKPSQLHYADVILPANVVVNQGARRADGLLPTPDDKLLEGLPCRFKFMAESEGLQAQKEIDFKFGRQGEPAALFTADASGAIGIKTAGTGYR